MSEKQNQELTPEQQKALMEAMANVTEMVAGAIEGLTKAILPIIQTYNALPTELKEQMAAHQVKQHLEAAMHISPTEATKDPNLAAIESSKVTNQRGDYMHGVDVDSNGVVNVYHFSDCEGGTDCALYKFLDADMDNHLQRPKKGVAEYWVEKDASGKFKFNKQAKKAGKDTSEKNQ